MDSRQLTTSLSNTRNSSKQAMPLSLNMTLSFIGKRFVDIHVNQDKTKTSMTKSRCITQRVTPTCFTQSTLVHSILHIYTPLFVDLFCFGLFVLFCLFCFFLFKVCVSRGSRSHSPRPNMSHTTGHAGHWEDLETWLSIATNSLLPKAAETLKHQTQDQLDDNIQASWHKTQVTATITKN